MKKIGILNHPISETISKMGHYDMLVIGDAGLPIPAGVKRIDLALIKGVPGFVETLKAVLTELQIESAVLAAETKEISPALYEQITESLGSAPVEFVDHETLKTMSGKAVAVIRTGEFTPYANIILKSGVIF